MHSARRDDLDRVRARVDATLDRGPNLVRCIGLDPDRLCRACLTGDYPTPTGNQLYQLALRNRHAETNGRTYELSVAANGSGGVSG